jgi:hypothetical protein
MSIETPTWDKIIGALGSTTAEFGGNWANLISDYFNGVNLALLDVSKIPIIGTLTRYKFEKLALFDDDQSHYISFSVDDIDAGSNRKIKFRRMITPFEEDYAMLEGLPQTILNKTIDSDQNTITNIVNADIKAAAGIVYSKLNLTNSLLASDLTSDSVTTIKILDANVTLDKLASNSVDSSKIVNDSIVNADINSAAAIAYSKLALTGSILNADINASAAIVTTKLADSANFVLTTRTNSFGDFDQVFKDNRIRINNPADTFSYTIIAAAIGTNVNLTLPLLAGNDTAVAQAFSQPLTNKTIDADSNTITNIDNNEIKAAAGIVYSKLTLTGGILNADINASAAIAYSKLALTGGILNADVNASAAIAYSKLALTNTILNADINSSAAIAYSKLALTGGILNADINASAAIATTKLADSSNFILKTLDNDFGAHHLDIGRIGSAPSNPSSDKIRLYLKPVDSNNDGLFCKVKKAGGFVEVQIL